MQNFDTPTPVFAVLDIPAGRVQLIAADRTDTVVEVRPADATKGRDVTVAEQTTIDFRNGVLSVEAEAKNHVLGSAGSIEVTVQLPAGSRVEVKAASVELRGVGRFGEVAVEGAQGDIKVDEAASVRVRTHAGDVSVGRLTGPAEITTDKGNILIAEAVRGTVVLSTQAGDVSVAAAAGSSAFLDAGTTLGRIHNALVSTTAVPELNIRATTAYGDITARSL
ncbi:DUF4097 family beta strand repeat-containing protein [Cellulomonas sp. URHE0023]|uniref:DUF4097 family beta strand repeat-containing protein n=1 Tax=Cellulomonas sp. URHE0023 TaxID=1380354 RepID=UPI000480E741|nr:DUF4097 family beta strand repeat-containing protein [Cellulomonas sp. URHE0023]